MKLWFKRQFNRFIKDPLKRFWKRFGTAISHHIMIILMTAAATIIVIHLNFQIFPKHYAPQLHVTCSFPCKCSLDGPMVVCVENRK